MCVFYIGGYGTAEFQVLLNKFCLNRSAFLGECFSLAKEDSNLYLLRVSVLCACLRDMCLSCSRDLICISANRVFLGCKRILRAGRVGVGCLSVRTDYCGNIPASGVYLWACVPEATIFMW